MASLRKSIGILGRDRSGAVAALVALLVPLFLIATAAAVDMGVLYVFRNKLQITADASALAGASALPDEDLTQVRALAAAGVNMPSDQHGNVLVVGDIITGNWSDARVFTPGGTPMNAVQVTTRRTAANGNPVASFFSPIFGVGSYDVPATAIATASSTNDCFRNGLVANGKVEAGSDDEFGVGACMHGQMGVKVGSKNHFQNGSVISMPDLDLLVQGSDNQWDGELVEQSMEAMTREEVIDLLNGVKSTASGASQIGGVNATPTWWNGTVQEWSGDFKNCNPADGILYIVPDDKIVDLTSCTGSLENFGVYTNKEIKLPSGSSSNRFEIVNMFFAGASIETGSYLTIGAATCEMAGGAVFLAARDFMKFGSNVDMTGVQMIAGANAGKLDEPGVEFGTDLHTSGITAQSAGMIKIGSNPLISVCDRADHVLTGGGVNRVLRLVQ